MGLGDGENIQNGPKWGRSRKGKQGHSNVMSSGTEGLFYELAQSLSISCSLL